MSKKKYKHGKANFIHREESELTYGEHRKAKEYDGTGHPAEAAAKQVGGNHYLGKKITHWGIVDEYGLDHYRGSAIKYIIRNKMDTYEDIQKAIHYLEKWLEVNKGLQLKGKKYV